MADIYSQANNIDLNQGVDTARAQKGQLTDLFGTQRGETAGYLGGLRDYINHFPSMAVMAQNIGDTLNLPNLRANANSLQNTMYELPQTYNAATRGYDVNQNQLSRIIGQKQSEIGPVAERASANANVAEQELGRRLGYAQQDFQNKLIPYQSEQALLSDRLARETSGYTTQMTNELNAIIDKIKQGVALTEGERTRANELAKAEKQYQSAVEVAKINNQPKPFAIANGSGVYNPSNNSYQQFGWG